MANGKGPVFRVQGLSALEPDDVLNTSLKATIVENLSEDERNKIKVRVDVVPSCYTEKERAALVEFPGGVPAFLSELTNDPLGDWQVEMGDVDISFDRHFLRFTQLYTPKVDSPVTAE